MTYYQAKLSSTEILAHKIVNVNPIFAEQVPAMAMPRLEINAK
jgi:hypothetical protein